MLTAAEKLRREGRREGEARGEARGKAQGKAEGKREILLLQLRQRFGRLPAAVVARIDKAESAALDAWSSRVLTATSLDEVLGAKVNEPLNEAAQPNQARPRGARRRTPG